MNKYREIAAEKGHSTAYQFWKAVGGAQTAAYRVYQDPNAIPSVGMMARVYAAYGVSPDRQINWQSLPLSHA